MAQGAEKRERYLGMCMLMSIAMLGLSACTGNTEGDLDTLEGEMTNLEQELTKHPGELRLCLDYGAICERVGSLCLRAESRRERQRCQQITQRCDQTLAKHCSEEPPRTDGGVGVDGGTPPDAGTPPDGSTPPDGGSACAPMDARGVGLCDAFFGYAYDGTSCVGLSGCDCAGTDCDRTFSSLRECEQAYARCSNDTCFVGGCSSELCTDDPNVISPCIFRPEFACYRDATCERQKSGACGWTETEELLQCLDQNQRSD